MPLGVLLFTAYCILHSTSAQARGEISSLDTVRNQATNLQYNVATDSGETVSYQWGSGENERLDGFDYMGNAYRFIGTASRVQVLYADGVDQNAQNVCGLFAESLDADSESVLSPSFPASNATQCGLNNLLAGRIVNRGTLDTFTNSPNGVNADSLSGVAGDLERIDVIFDTGIVTPVQDGLLQASGHLVAEMRGDNAVQVAAITSLDAQGNPAGYAPLVRVHPLGCNTDQLCFGQTAKFHEYTLMKRDSSTQVPVAVSQSRDAVAAAFVSVADLGLSAGQTYYGISFFANDVNAGSHNLLQPETFPRDTGNSPDLYGGQGGYYLLGGASIAHGHVFRDDNGNGWQDPEEPDLPNISLSLFADNNNGVFDADDVRVGERFVTDGNGNILIPALPNGNYWLLLDLDDSLLPEGFGLNEGNNPLSFTLSTAPQLLFGLSRPLSGDTTDDTVAGADTGNGNSVGDGDSGDGSGSGTGDNSGTGDGTGTADPGGSGDTDGSGSGAETGDAGGSGDTDDSGNGAGTGDGGDANGSGGTDGAGGGDGDNGGAGDAGSGDGTGTVDGGLIIGAGTDADGNAAGADDGLGGATDIEAEENEPLTVGSDNFSDLNNNGIDDFEECDCDTIGLQTGIDGHGAGAFGGLGLMILGLLVVRRHRGNMNAVIRGGQV